MNMSAADTDKPYQPLRSPSRKVLNPLSGSAVRQDQLTALVDIQKAINRHDCAMSRTVNTDIKYTDAVMWVYPQRYQGGSHDDKYENVPIILAFNWTPTPTMIMILRKANLP